MPLRMSPNCASNTRCENPFSKLVLELALESRPSFWVTVFRKLLRVVGLSDISVSDFCVSDFPSSGFAVQPPNALAIKAIAAKKLCLQNHVRFVCRSLAMT